MVSIGSKFAPEPLQAKKVKPTKAPKPKADEAVDEQTESLLKEAS